MLRMDLHTEDVIGPGGTLICIKGTQLANCSVKALTCVECHKKLVLSCWFDGSQALMFRWEGDFVPKARVSATSLLLR